MPLKDELVMSMKEGLVELTAELTEPERDPPEDLREQVRDRLEEHLHEIMTDAAILDGDSVEVASVIMCRDPIPAPSKQVLATLGLSAKETPSGGHEESSLFSGLKRPKRSRLEKWSVPYTRAAGALRELEGLVSEEVPDGPMHEIHEYASQALIDGARHVYRLLLAPGREWLETFEGRFAKDRGTGRLVLQPAFVRAIAAFAGASIQHAAPDTTWEDDEDAPLYVASNGGLTVRTDPVLRVIAFVKDPRRAALTAYLDAVVQQSEQG
ncbi:MAG: hypothetical protein HYV07_15685 [Deltaproteobacteria bacterium]|nr:hypothetical protein [Deltaproteobacteria bacterium]